MNTLLRRLASRLQLPSVAAVLVLAAFPGCSRPPAKTPAQELALATPPYRTSLGTGPSIMVETDEPYNMWIAESVHTSCGGPDPFFAFDVAKPTGGDQPTMRNLVTCMKGGPLEGKSIKLVGHTDPRGPADYNLELGLKRAEKVKTFLVTHGIAPERVLTASIGEEGARLAPKEWARDRRVEVQLAP